MQSYIKRERFGLLQATIVRSAICRVFSAFHREKSPRNQGKGVVTSDRLSSRSPRVRVVRLSSTAVRSEMRRQSTRHELAGGLRAERVQMRNSDVRDVGSSI